MNPAFARAFSSLVLLLRLKLCRNRFDSSVRLLAFALSSFLILLSSNGEAVQAAPEASATARVMAGTDRVVAKAPGGAVVQPYENYGYRLEVRDDGHVEVTVRLSPLESSAPFELPLKTTTLSGIESLSRSLVSGSRTQYTAAARILAWVGRNIRYDLDRNDSQEAQLVLERRTGYCTGISRLTVVMLKSVGLDAREVSGYVVGETPGAPTGYHRWIEVKFDDKGWVFSDPTSSHHFVPATYVRLASETLDLTRSHRSRLVSRDQKMYPVDVYPHASSPILARRNSVRQRAASINIEVEGARRGRAWLTSTEERQTLDFTRGRGAFVGLPTGRYDLIVVTDQGDRFRRIVHFKNPVNMRLELGSDSRSEQAKQSHGRIVLKTAESGD